MKLEDAIIPLGIGALIGVGLNMMKGNTISMATEAPETTEAQALNAEGEVDITLGQEPASEGYNTSEVWDFRDRVYNNDNVLYNKLPFIDLSPTGEWDPNNPKVIGSREFDCAS
jgi:hypothetical protein